ncbi:DUF5134 domain-containing protein [Streptomyces fuscigenes]|uniref:DUF5134 domain-containing protein n=1 Tax=Streptomyces fuscigenes TaxID=1528880 RepID=UPI003556A7B8
MHAPLLVSWLLVAVCSASGAYCVLRTRSRVPQRRTTARGEALMGFGMAAMALPAAVVAPPAWVWTLYVGLFAAAALVAGGAIALRRGRPGHHLHHLLGMLAMVYMAWVMAAAPAGHASMTGMAGMGAAAGPPGSAPVTGLLLLYFAGYVLWAGARLMPGTLTAGAGTAGGPGPGRGPAVGWGERPELALACRLSMGTAMLAMLLTL